MAPKSTTTSEPIPKSGPPEDLERILKESAKALRDGDGPPKRRAPGRPRKDETAFRAAGDAAEPSPEAPPLAQAAIRPPDEASIQESTRYIIEGCEFAAKETGYEGFKAKEPEAVSVARRVERVVALYTDRFTGPTAVWTFAIGSVSWFVGKRLMGFKRWQLEQFAKSNPDPRGPDGAQAEANGAAI